MDSCKACRHTEGSRECAKIECPSLKPEPVKQFYWFLMLIGLVLLFAIGESHRQESHFFAGKGSAMDYGGPLKWRRSQ